MESQLVKQVNLLKQYSKALQTENHTKDVERKHLQMELQKIKRQFDESSTKRNQSLIQIHKLKEIIQREIREKTTLQTNYDNLLKQISQKTDPPRIISSSPCKYKEDSEQINWKYKYESLEKQIQITRESQRRALQQKSSLEITITSLQKELSRINLQLYNRISEIQTKQTLIKNLKSENTRVISSVVTKSQYQKNETEENYYKQSYEKLSNQLHQIKDNREKKYTQERNNYQVRIYELQRKQTLLCNQIYLLKSEVELQINEINRLKRIIQKENQTQEQNVKKYSSKHSSYTFRNELVESLQSQLQQSNYLKSHMSSLQLEINSKKTQISLQKKEIQTNHSTINSQYAQLSAKDQQINRLRQQIQKLQQKIYQLTFKIDREIVTTANSKLTTQGGETLILKAQLNRVFCINQSLSHQISQLQNENIRYIERLKDYERRIQILQETNSNLQKQLRNIIEKRKHSGNNEDEEELRQIINDLRRELIENKEYLMKIRNQKQQIRETISNETQMQFHRIKKPYNFYFNYKENRTPDKTNQEISLNSCRKTNNDNKRGHQNQSLNLQKWQKIQRKINILEGENLQLKKTLYDFHRP